jgi:hypothetical protein
MSSARWRRQPTWVINKDTGSDRNDGHDSAHALQHWEELYRRWGPRAYLRDLTCTISCETALASGDYMFLDVVLGNATTITVNGTKTTAGLPSGTLTTYVDVNRTVGAESMPKITDTALGASGFSGSVDKLCKITGGARAGTGFFIVKDLGSKTARISTPVTIDTPLNYLTPTRKVPAVTDPYQVYNLPSIAVGDVHCELGTNKAVVDAVGGYVLFNQLNLDVRASGTLFARGPLFGFQECILNQPIIDSDFYQNTNCLHLPVAGASWANQGPYGAVAAGATKGSIAIFGGQFFAIDFDHYLQPSSLISLFNTGSRVLVGSMAIFDGTPSRTLIIEAGTEVQQSASGDADALWGTNNNGWGIDCRGTLTYVNATALAVNKGLGAGREVRIGGTDKLWSDLPYFENLNGASVSLGP